MCRHSTFQSISLAVFMIKVSLKLKILLIKIKSMSYPMIMTKQSLVTSMFRLLEVIAEDSSRIPAAILGFPVGFVGAAESKEVMCETDHGVPYITLLGRRGGSAMAAAAVNALASGSEI